MTISFTPITLAKAPALALLAGTALLAAGCSQGTSSDSATTSAPASTPTTSSTDCPLTVSDGWVKAANEGMTAAFGTVQNSSDADVVITGASTPASSETELHETVDQGGAMQMQQVQQFTVPANGELPLQPSGNHIMLMNVTSPVAAGQDVDITLTCDGGGTAEFHAQARDFDGADESYAPDGSGSMSMAPGESMAPDGSMPDASATPGS